MWTGNRSYPDDYEKPRDTPTGRIDPAVFRQVADAAVPFDDDMPPGLADLLALTEDPTV